MKKILSLVLSLLLLIGLSACGGTSTGDDTAKKKDNQEQSSQENSQSQDESQNQENNQNQSQANTGAFELGDDVTTGDYVVKINSLRKSIDMNGNPAVIVNYDYTNNSEETTSALGSILVSVFQDGIQLDNAIGAEGIESDNYIKQVRPGNTIQGCEEGFITTSDSPLEIEIIAASEMFSGETQLVNADMPE